MESESSQMQAILQRVIQASPADETQVLLSNSDTALTRFANNGIHQNLTGRDSELTVGVRLGCRAATATTNRLDPEGIRRVVEDACRLARLSPEQDLPPLPGSQRYIPLERFDSDTAHLTARQRADAVGSVISRVRDQDLTTAGFLSNETTVTAMANSRGLFAFHRATEAEFSITVLDGDSSGWAKQFAPAIGEVLLESMAEEAIQKAVLGRSPREIEPGAYTVILAPSAAADLIGFLVEDFSALEVHLKQSCLTDRLDSRMLGENISIVDDWCHPAQMGWGFDGDGMPRTKVTLVERGVVRGLVCSRTTARRVGGAATGHGHFFEPGEMPANLVMTGGESSLEEMIRSTERGLLISRFWYIREVDSMQKILTGMTRDGTFFIENGQVRYGVKNLRFNQGLVKMLNQVVLLGRSVRAAGEEHTGCLVIPPMKVEGFNFTNRTVF